MTELGTGVVGGILEHKSIQNRTAGQREAIETSSDALIHNQTQAMRGQTANQDRYLGRMTQAHQDYAQGQINAATVGASQAAGGESRNGDYLRRDQQKCVA